MYKLIACDLDETLLTSDKTVSKRDVEALKRADALGVKIVLATGRGIVNVENTLKALGLDGLENEYVISLNGGGISENKGDQFLYTQGVPFEFASRMYKEGLKYDVSVQVYTKKEVYVYNYTDAERNRLEAEGIELIEIFSEEIDFLEDEEIIKVIYMNEDYRYLEKVEEDLQNLLVDSDVSYSSNRYLEFNQKGVNKGTALEFIADHLGIKMSETLAIGDNYNDHSMFERAGFAVGVQNMVPGLRDEVDYITKATHDESAVAEVIHKFILNEDN